MDLYVRSQNGMSLLNYDRITIEPVVDKEKGCMFIGDHYYNMGKYKSKERALEILDEIQKFRDTLIGLELLPENTREQMVLDFLKNNGTFTYCMPKE